MKANPYSVFVFFFLICSMCFGQNPANKKQEAEITYKVLSPENRTVGVGIGREDSVAVDPFYVGDVTVPSTIFSGKDEYKVVGITDYAFKDCNGIKQVQLGRNISVIGKEAFYGCMGLTRVLMPSTLLSIGDGAFEGSGGVMSLEMSGQNLAVVGKRAFAGCTDIESVRMQPKTMTSVGERAFAGCAKLKKVFIFGRIAVIGKGAFAGCTNLTEIVISADSVMSIGNDAFQGCENLQTITIRGSQPVIGTGVFAGCKNLKEVRCYTDVPPTAADGLFTEANVSAVVLKVNPANSELFKDSPSWKGFQMVEADETALGFEGDYVFALGGVEEAPEFPGGNSSLLTYLARNVKYPAKAQENGIKGTVLVEFVVNKDGSVVEPKVIESLGTDCDFEALRAVSSMPKWKPGKQNGKPVQVRYTVPIQFMMGFPNTIPNANNAANVRTNVNNKAANANTQVANVNLKVASNGADDDDVYDAVEEMPEFPGGQAKLLEFIARNVKYPVKAQENGIQGTVIISFVVGKDGNVTEPKVTRSLDPQTDAEALRVISAMPKWKPGKQNGKPLRVKYNVPIQFRLH